MVIAMETQGFKVIPLKFSKENTAQHSLYVKEHSVREKTESKPPHRTLFVLNVPPYCTEESLRNAFSERSGCRVTGVYFHKKPTSAEPDLEQSKVFRKSSIKGFKVAYIVFESASGLKTVLSSTAEPILLSSSRLPVLTGCEKWAAEYNGRIVDSAVLQAEIDAFMANYDEQERESRQKEKEEGADEEGWVTVTKRGRNPGFSRKESVHRKVMGRERQKRSRKELLNFYTFQIRESKMKHIAELRQKFEEDKKRISVLKQARRFKPF
ncbi:ribosomal RNA-processing protein 7 homolog A isoform X2 [Ischnura elegans]|uniref:ribosomal RNA-processing protein 7 homolog A isoform X2 n=1 Tax=Ischnura elegans TaxID=197161 RepID=UPI001ED86959|nr:ribosomal RNA-processing protein 7 homolog A isoform X2 [Ischnura elegans]